MDIQLGHTKLHHLNEDHTVVLFTASGLSMLAGVIHLVVAPDHLAEWLGYGLFFIISSSAQIFYAVLLLTQMLNRRLLVAGILGNSSIIVLYLITRTFGIPFFGPHAGMVEAIGGLDILSKIDELALILCLVILLRTQPVSKRAGNNSSV